MNNLKALILTGALLALLSSPAWAWGVMGMAGGSAAPAGFCSGSELFCEDFEGDDVAWDAANGAVDCDGYDADGDYCDDEATVYKMGSQALGIRGNATYYVREALSTPDQSEYYFEMWFYLSGTISGASDPIGVFTGGATPYPQAAIYYNWGALYFATEGGATTIDSTGNLSATTWYHIGVYISLETGDGSANNGVVRIWMNTDGGTFDAADLLYASTSVDTGTLAGGYGGDLWVINGPEADIIAYLDNNKVVAGSCPWAYE